MASMPASTNAFEATVLPVKQPFIGRGWFIMYNEKKLGETLCIF
jgi:hypothetical protein